MTVEVNDHGDGRADMGDGRIMLLLGGVTYVVEADARGSYLVRLEDVEFENNVTIADGRFPAHGPIRPPATSVQRVRLVRVGTEIVAHHRGTLWRIVNPAAPAGGGDDYVVSDDPRLAPLNLMVSPQGPAAPARRLDPTGAAAARWAIYRRGAILREGQHLLLQRAEVRPIPEPFVLPGPILTREAYSARRRSSTRD